MFQKIIPIQIKFRWDRSWRRWKKWTKPSIKLEKNETFTQRITSGFSVKSLKRRLRVIIMWVIHLSTTPYKDTLAKSLDFHLSIKPTAFRLQTRLLHLASGNWMLRREKTIITSQMLHRFNNRIKNILLTRDLIMMKGP